MRGMTMGISPVSYTHLDVYKRQVEKGLKGGVVYHDGQFDDSRMAVNLAQTCVEHGGTVLNQATVTGILHDDAGRVAGVRFTDNLTGESREVKARSVVNAAGCFVDDIMHMDCPDHSPMVRCV